MKLKKLDYINVAAIALTVMGVLLEIVGSANSIPETVGINLALSPMVYLGIALIAVSLVTAVTGSVITERHGMNKLISTVALYLAVIALMFGLVYLVLTIVMPVLNPTNG